MIRRTIGAAILTAAMAGAAMAQQAGPVIIYDSGGKFDKSFNEAAYNGAEKFKKDTGVAYRDFEIQNDSQREQSLRNFAQRGNSPIVIVGFLNQKPLEKVAKEFPAIKFAIIDSVVEAPNVRSILFKEEEGSYLVGLLAGLTTKTGKVGFVGGMDIPLISKFACGYAQGAKAAKPGVEVFQNMVGSTPAAWNDPVKGGELAKGQIARGADIVYAAAGASGNGVLQAAAEGGKLSIGVDSNQNHLYPGKVLTSMLKRVDTAVYDAFSDGKNDKFTGGIQVLGLKENGVGWALDDNNKALVTADAKAAVEKAQAGIIAGTIKVHDYTTDKKCP